MSSGQRALDEREASASVDALDVTGPEDTPISRKSITIDLGLASLVVTAVGIVFAVMLWLFNRLNEELEKARTDVKVLIVEQTRQGEDLKRLRDLLDDRDRELKERIDFVASPLRVRIDTLETRVASPGFVQSGTKSEVP